MNDNKIDSEFLIFFFVILRYFIVIFIIILIDKVFGSKYSGIVLLCCINIIVDWVVVYLCNFLIFINSKLVFFLFSLLILV